MQEEGKNYYTTALKFPDSFAKPSKNVGGARCSQVPSLTCFWKWVGEPDWALYQYFNRGLQKRRIHDSLIVDNFMITIIVSFYLTEYPFCGPELILCIL